MHHHTRTKVLLLVILGLVSGTISYLVTRRETQAAPRATWNDDVQLVNIANSSMKRVEAEYSDDLLSIDATASIRDQRPGSFYVWAFRILDADKKVVASFIYDDEEEIVELTSGEAIKPKLDESMPLPLPAGFYRAEVFIFRVPPAFDADKIKINDPLFSKYFNRGMTGSMGGAKFSIP